MICSLLLFCGYNIHRSTYHFNGITGATKKNGAGCICHDPVATPSVAVWVAGPETLAAGEEATYALFVARDTAVAGGFDLATEFGVLGVVDSLDTYWYENELTHTQPKLFQGSDTILWHFSYRAPDSLYNLVDTIFSAANVVNLDTNATAADTWNFGHNFRIRVVGTTSVREPVPSGDGAAAFHLSQNYPNPFNPTTAIRYRLTALSHVSLKIYSILGREVATLVNGRQGAGYWRQEWSAEGVASGVYIYRLDAREMNGGHMFTDSKKMVVLK